MSFACESDTSSLVVTNADSVVTNFRGDGTDQIGVTVKINNPPTAMSVQGLTYILGNITYSGLSDPGMSGVPSCIGGIETEYEYTCVIPVSINQYNHSSKR